ncbi:MAG: glycosyltransferase [Sphingobacteriaceae bacterium]
MLKVVHLNTYDGNGGAGRACLRLSQALNNHGVHSKVIVNYKFGNNKAIETFSGTWLKKAYTTAAIILERLLAKLLLKPVKIPFSFTWFGRSVIHHPDVMQADVIHLHWINHSFLNPQHLAELKQLNKPIVWTFHDSNAFTGGCHVRFDCDHFIRQCGDCPVLKHPGPADWSNRIWHQKHDAYKDLLFHIIVPSKWMGHAVKVSSLLKDKPINIIPNTLETATFDIQEVSTARLKWKLDEDKFIFLSGFMPSRKDLHKGTSYLLESMELLAQKGGINKDQIEVIIFGNRKESNVPVFPFKTHLFGTIHHDEDLASIFAAADAFLIPSLDDNLPYTVMESLSCGTPVIAFTTGGIPDMVKHQENGYLAVYRSAESFADGMEWIIKHPDRTRLRKNARQTVMTNFSEDVVTEQHIRLYQSLLS